MVVVSPVLSPQSRTRESLLATSRLKNGRTLLDNVLTPLRREPYVYTIEESPGLIPVWSGHVVLEIVDITCIANNAIYQRIADPPFRQDGATGPARLRARRSQAGCRPGGNGTQESG
ncbi:hypothetical protein KGM_201730 [Danaus plexippus plexippus]|uniref:Uncharacterized protein n=1 Tax=Danaus plexippus plexippus TaxID=278856 RepID=A0A212EVQ9_DANPL|nr:hypothetical protein KGM_201730 [Danaus plexippus plexippus]